ncbi:MAG: protein-export chaperone SecB, partial [Bacteroidales bacterium]
RPVFIVELAYGGIFTVNVAPEHVQAMLLIECPRLLFPFARTIVADMTRDGGFPPLMVQPIDFVQLFRARMEAAQSEAVGHA